MPIIPANRPTCPIGQARPRPRVRTTPQPFKAVLAVDATKDQGAAAEKLAAAMPHVKDENLYTDPVLSLEELAAQ